MRDDLVVEAPKREFANRMEGPEAISSFSERIRLFV
jgi:hypothetical protein